MSDEQYPDPVEAFKALREAAGGHWDNIDVDKFMAHNRDEDYVDGELTCPCGKTVPNYYERCPDCKTYFGGAQ